MTENTIQQTEATESTEATEAAEAAETNEPTEATEATEAAETAETNEATEAAEAIKYKVKVDGEEKELPLEEILAGYQTRQASTKRFTEARRLAAQAEQALQALQHQPIEVLQHLGVDVRQLAENYLVEALQEETMSETEREALQTKRELEKYRKLEEQRKLTSAQKAIEAQKVKYAEDYSREFEKALQEIGIPKNSFTVGRMAQYLLAAQEKGLNVTAADVAPHVRAAYVNEIQSLFSSSDPEKMLELIGQEGVKKIRAHEIAKLKANQAEKPAQTPSTLRKKSEKMDINEFFRKKREELGLER